ncbi:MAG: flagellar assembly peptidoglycan hydrolase FlgJ [Pseudomonadales bacterium]
MNPVVDQTFHFADFQAFSALRREAAQDTPEARRVVARQFEALFVQQLLAQMRQASEVDGGLIDNERLKPYQSMHDQQLALTLAEGGGIGLADAILRQLGEAPMSAGRELAAGLSLSPVRRTLEPAAPQRLRQQMPMAADGAFRPATPEAFVDGLRPHVAPAARRLGVQPEVLIAQAALETGWGQHRIVAANGRDSFNLFGIKATSDWQGDTVTVSTLEFIDGVPERRRERFRAYSGLAEAVADYADVVASRPRYEQARAAGSSEGYLRGLQAGGYATDPLYADKILAILRRGLPGGAVQVSAAAADSDSAGPAIAASDSTRGVTP